MEALYIYNFVPEGVSEQYQLIPNRLLILNDKMANSPDKYKKMLGDLKSEFLLECIRDKNSDELEILKQNTIQSMFHVERIAQTEFREHQKSCIWKAQQQGIIDQEDYQDDIDVLFKGRIPKQIKSQAATPIQDQAQELHRLLCSKLSLENNVPGDLRVHHVRTVKSFSHPLYRLVPRHLKNLDLKIESLKKRNASSIEIAAVVSFEILRIHPFVDYNGRVSRLLLNQMLLGAGLPFWINVRENEQEYILALQQIIGSEDYSVYQELILKVIMQKLDCLLME